MSEALLYHYRVRVTRVIDGDSFVADIDLGFRVWLRNITVRVLGVDCPELTGPTRAAGLAARGEADAWLSSGPVTVRTHLRDTDNFGRVLAEVWRDGNSLADHLINAGAAVPYAD